MNGLFLNGKLVGKDKHIVPMGILWLLGKRLEIASDAFITFRIVISLPPGTLNN